MLGYIRLAVRMYLRMMQGPESLRATPLSDVRMMLRYFQQYIEELRSDIHQPHPQLDIEGASFYSTYSTI